MGRPYRILIACYGGGHVQSLIPLARALQAAADVELTVIGFTTARAAFQRAGVEAVGYTVLEPYLLHPCLDLLAPFLPDSGHPDVSEEETRAYFHVGMHDLIEQLGEAEALRRITEQGRVAFQPEATLRRYLEQTAPDLVVTSTSPRSELALQRAARELGITGLAVSDLFLQHEASYLCAPGYAEHISVIAQYVADHLRQAGCDCTQLHVTGNPAFDGLFTEQMRAAGAAIRSELGLAEGERLVTWIGTPQDVSLRGKRFVQNAAVIARLEAFCAANPGHRYAIRPHPNRPFELPDSLCYAHLLGSAYPIEAVLWASDTVLLETSTVGLQAALIGRDVITVAAEDYPPYASLGLATDVPDLEALDAAILARRPPSLQALGPVGLGDAGERVLALIDRLLGRDAGGADD